MLRMHVKTSPTTVSNIENLKVLFKKYSFSPDLIVSPLSSVNERNFYGDQLIHFVCVAGANEDLKLLLESGADVNSRGEDGFTPLHYAAEQGHLKTVKYLLDCGADKTVENRAGLKPIELAQENSICYELLDQN